MPSVPVPEANDPPMGGEADRTDGSLLGWGMDDDVTAGRGGVEEGGRGMEFSKVVMARR